MTKLAATTRAQLAAWRGVAHETRWRLRAATARYSSLLLVIAGGLGVLGGAYIVGRWLFGLALMAESAVMIYVGMNRDDGTDLPARGARTAEQVLDDERLRP